MKKIIRFSWIYSLVGVILCSILFSFSTRMAGAHSFQVYLDNKLMIDQYVNSKMNAPTLLVNPAENYSQLIVKYNECGRTVTGRTITIKDGNNKVLKDWRFEGVSTGYENPMAFQIKDITALKQKGSNTFRLYYSSKEFPEGQQIANLVIGGEAKTALK
jgi:hypothetical protein